uniref:Secreted protein n=1 Tax=Anguilla anguilla TaxID=7936 RepID=A0A0E9WLT9_ANGAN
MYPVLSSLPVSLIAALMESLLLKSCSCQQKFRQCAIICITCFPSIDGDTDIVVFVTVRQDENCR